MSSVYSEDFCYSDHDEDREENEDYEVEEEEKKDPTLNNNRQHKAAQAEEVDYSLTEGSDLSRAPARTNIGPP